LTELHLPDRAAATLRFAPIILPIALLFAALATAGLLTLWRRSQRTFWIVAAWFLFPIGFAVGGTLITRFPFNVRYVILALPSFLIVVALGVCSLRDPARWLAMCAFVFVSIYSIRNYLFEPRYFREDNRAAGVYLAGHAAAGDLVIADAPYTALNLQYYARRADISYAGFPRPIEVFDTVPRSGGVFRRSASTQMTNQGADSTNLNRTISGRRSFWVFLSRSYHGAPANEIVPYCEGRFSRNGQFSTPNDILLIHYERVPTTN
jgi:hypothetical protein